MASARAVACPQDVKKSKLHAELSPAPLPYCSLNPSPFQGGSDLAPGAAKSSFPSLAEAAVSQRAREVRQQEELV